MFVVYFITLILDLVLISQEQAIHPNLFFSPDDVNRLRQQATTTHRKIFARLATAAEDMKTKPSKYLPSRDWEKFASRWNEDHGNNFGALAMYCLINHTDLQARKVAFQFFDNFVSLPNWRVKASMVDDVPVAHSLVAMATAYDFLYQFLHVDLRGKTLAKIANVTKELYERSFQISWGSQYIQNHVATNYVAMFIGALAVEQEIEEANIWKLRAHHMLQRTMFLLNLVKDGSLEEGVAYGSYTTRSLTQYIFLAKRHLGIDLTDNAWLREHFWFLYRTTLPGFTETVGIADSNLNWFYGPESQLVFLDNYVLRNGYGNWLAAEIQRKRLEDSKLRSTLAHRFCTLHTEYIFYDSSIPEVEPPNASIPQLHVFSDWGVVTYGGGALEKDGRKHTFLSFKTSVLHGRAINAIFRQKVFSWIEGSRNFNPGHEHPDQGSFVFAPHGIPFITEALYGPKYTWLNNALMFGPPSVKTCSKFHEGQIGDCNHWLQYKADDTWLADAELMAASEKDGVVFASGEYSGWYRSSLDLKSVYRVVMLLNSGVLLVVDHIETRENSSTRYVSAFFHNRKTPFILEKTRYGETIASITLDGRAHYVAWFNGYQGNSRVESQGTQYNAEAGMRETHFLNITTALAPKQTRLAYLFIAPGNDVTTPKLEEQETGVKVYLKINGLPHWLSIATNIKKRCNFLGFDGLAKVKIHTKPTIAFGREGQVEHLSERHVSAFLVSEVYLSLLAWVFGISAFLYVQRSRRRWMSCNQRMCATFFIGGMIIVCLFHQI